MENTETLSDEDENSDEDSEDMSEESDSDSDGGLRAYTVASNDFVPSFEVKTKVKTKGGKTQLQEDEVNATSTPPSEAVKETSREEVTNSPEQNWSQSQQKALEAALVQFPKGTTERWERIANKVPGKTKDQCILRFKNLAEMVKKKKEASANEQ